MKKDETTERGRAFAVTITETYQRTIVVYENELKEATAQEARKTVEDWWKDSQIELTQEDFQNVDFYSAEIMKACEDASNAEGGE